MEKALYKCTTLLYTLHFKSNSQLPPNISPWGLYWRGGGGLTVIIKRNSCMHIFRIYAIGDITWSLDWVSRKTQTSKKLRQSGVSKIFQTQDQTEIEFKQYFPENEKRTLSFHGPHILHVTL